MIELPAFFEPIRAKSAARWDQLDHDPELAGPWHQLFKQVQSPRHVLSELLQNADDAGAREASARIENGTFLFEHDGEDFAEDHFASLCRFGYSNKRHLHTIGFRGIGFKSTFSLGDCVEVSTPSLAVSFDRRRFTEPRWSERGTRSDGKTCIQVAIKDDHRRGELQKNLEEWQQSPLSLLFFRHLRRLRIGDADVCWRSVGAGPVPDSEWMAPGDGRSQRYLLIRSQAERFPDEAMAEIRQERMLAFEEEAGFPPSKVEIVLGAPGRLFVVLPTGVETGLPFACNAPFIQDPARLKIKDPETSPTNRWLLQRVGDLAATSMLRWLGRSEVPHAERAAAYGLFPDVNRTDYSLESVCRAVAEEAFEKRIDGQCFLLTDDGSIVESGQSVALPDPILEVWPPQQAAALFDEEGRPALSRDVTTVHRRRLLHKRAVEEIDKTTLLTALKERHLPRPETWQHLLNLWAYVAHEVTAFYSSVEPTALRIVPVEGREVLYAADEVVRTGEKKVLASEDDWRFLAEHLMVLHHAWPRFIADRRRYAEERADIAVLKAVNAAAAVLKKIDLEDSTDVSRVIERVAAEFFSKESVNVAGCVQLAQVAAKLKATAGNSFRYVTRDGHLRLSTDHVLFDNDGRVEEIVPPAQRASLLLHQDYTRAFRSCTREEWTDWIAAGRARMLSLPPLIEREVRVYGRKKIADELRLRGADGAPCYHYVTNEFFLADWDFDEAYWGYWHELAQQNELFWATLVERVLAQRESYWREARSSAARQIATTGSTRSITSEPLLPSWVLRLRDLPCLRDTRGFSQKPGNLLRRTPKTEALIDVEAFVHGSLDSEATRPLLDLLGVRSTPTGPDRLLGCLRALAMSETPPIHEVERWYRRLDQMMDTCSTEDLRKIKDALRSEKLILTAKGVWTNVSSVFLTSAEGDVPGAEIIRESVADLSLWRKLGVAERPTVDLAIQWLRELPSGRKLSQGDLARVHALLRRYPGRIWEDCGHWINLAGEWTATEALCYALTMQWLIPWSHLHEWVKQKTADLQRLPVEATGAPPFSALPELVTQLEDRFHGDPLVQGEPEERSWLTTLGSELCRIEVETDDETNRVRSLARKLARTRWQRTPRLEIVPYIDGTPAGTPRRADVLWLKHVLYVNDLPKAKLAKRVPEEIANAFNRPEIKAALDYSFERSPEDVRAYLEENFRLASALDADGAEAPEDQPVRAAINSPNDKSEADRPDMASTRAAAAERDGAERRTSRAATADPVAKTDDVSDNTDAAGVRLRSQQNPGKPSIIERFAAAQGFRKDAEGRFFHANGSWIARTRNGSFPWERKTASGDTARYYWAEDRCLEREPLVLEADVWGLIADRPNLYALILADFYGEPIEVNGTSLVELKDQQKLKLYPATYRLVMDGDSDA